MRVLSTSVALFLLAFLSKPVFSDGGLELESDDVNMNCMAICQPMVQLTTLCNPQDSEDDDDKQNGNQGAGTNGSKTSVNSENGHQDKKRSYPVQIRQAAPAANQTCADDDANEAAGGAEDKRKRGGDVEQEGQNEDKRRFLPISRRQDNQSDFDGEQEGENENKKRSLPVSVRQDSQDGFDGEQTGDNNNNKRAGVPLFSRGKRASKPVSANVTSCVCTNKSFNMVQVATLWASCQQQNGIRTKKINKTLNTCNITSTSTYTPASISVLSGINVVVNGVSAVNSSTPAGSSGSGTTQGQGNTLGTSGATAILLGSAVVWTMITSVGAGFVALMVL